MFATNVYPEFLPDGDELVARIHGEIDHHSAKLLREETDHALRRYRPTVLVLDLGGVTFMDSSGLGFVLGRVNTAEEIGCRVEVHNAKERVRRILCMAGISRMKSILICGEEGKGRNKNEGI